MKRITILVVLLFSITLTTNAQEAKTYHEQMKIMTSELDATRFTNNTLYDKVYPLANLRSFNQNEQKDTSNYKHFKQAVHELHLAGDKQVIRSVKDIDQSAISLKMDNKVLIGIINMNISHIKTDAYDIANQKMHIDSTGAVKKMIEIADKEPYETIQTLVISPLQGRIEQVSGQPVVFNFLQGMIQKSTNPIKTLNVDFGNGVNHNVISNRRIVNIEVPYSFPTEGNYTLKFSGAYQDGTIFETYGTLTVKTTPPPPPPEDEESGFIRATETFTPYIPDEEIPTSGYSTNFEDSDTGEYISELPRVDYRIWYSSVTSTETKPLWTKVP